MVQIIRAEHLGFCFGVRDALATAENVSHPERTSVYGELVHNQEVTRELSSRQFELLSELDRESLPDRPVVMVTAHGISNQRRQRLLDAGKELVDTTCPLVRRVHDAAMMLADRGYFVVVIGKSDHVEVLGIVEDLPPGRWVVVADPADVPTQLGSEIGIVCQTTMPEEIALACRNRIAEQHPDSSIRWINTICRPTKQRQAAVDLLCEQVDVVVVVGGSNSNNTRRLVDRCIASGCQTYHVQSADDLQSEWIDRCERIGLTAGTSTPDATIDAVQQRIVELSAQNNQQLGERKQTCSAPAATSSYASWDNAQWSRYFVRNLAEVPTIPWSDSPTLTETERAAIATSVQTFQLGESGEGRHIKRCAREWIERAGDPDYLAALTLFLQEENQHAAWLGRLLTQEGVPLLQKQWSDGCFRFLRHLAGLRTSISVLVTAEILAQVYYLALMRATDSPTLRGICRRILRDERAHVVFQQSQKGKLSAEWGNVRRICVHTLETILFEVARRIVWHEHRVVFRAASMDWTSYRNRTSRRWTAACKWSQNTLVTGNPSDSNRENR
ncbi:LytB protein [Rhodopirellula maiorica SM1]|uniref:4-hydroxy-3-methylbut-2-enyl diphosphate reductase n=1 Tax=Rhodopirellula maiorica SM1 TaxID=1265738 RepID=M5RG69_9BACT|nr:4-hydroxy-3-methylbut-2-enyl diphosphate reductase [Rhodopirellula maiorica]EMI18388.1 LytB protein [Rhodopirellula maiorica SM1]